jgi:hypothetical protein
MFAALPGALKSHRRPVPVPGSEPRLPRACWDALEGVQSHESHHGDKMASYLTSLGDEQSKLRPTFAMRSLNFGLKKGHSVYDRNSVYEA